MSSFHDIRFPLPLAFGASGGPVRQTEITTLVSGHEQRNTSQAFSRRRYDAGVGVKSVEDMQMLINFYEARFGELYAFRFRDPLDHNSAITGKSIIATDQVIGTGDGVQTEFQLVKTYGDSAAQSQRLITKPIGASIVAALDGNETTAFSVDVLTGIVALNTPPASGVLVTAGYEFDVPVRFATDHLSATLDSFGAGGAVHVPLVEVKTNA